MTFLTFLEVIKIIGAVAGALLAIVSFIGLLTKKPKKWFADTVRQQSIEANKDLEEKINILMVEKEENKNRAIVTYRHSITNIYEKYKDEKKLPGYVKQDLCSLYEQYEKLGGNSYVHTIVAEMKNWD